MQLNLQTNFYQTSPHQSQTKQRKKTFETKARQARILRSLIERISYLI